MSDEPTSAEAPADPAVVVLAVAEAADLVEVTARALPLEVAGRSDAATALDLWAPAIAALTALAARADLGPLGRQDVAALRIRAAELAPALAALRAAAGP